MRPPRQGSLNDEPALEDVLSDPIVCLLMRRDRVDPEDFSKLITVARRHLQTVNSGRANGDRNSSGTPRGWLCRLLSQCRSIFLLSAVSQFCFC